jgi:hypothetical protein
MSFFQNVFEEEFRGHWLLEDRQYVIDFICPPNRNKSNYQLAWNVEPYDLSTTNTLTINYAWDNDFKNYSSLSINVAGATPAVTRALEVVNALNANAVFAEMWVAQIYPYQFSTQPMGYTVLITKKSGRIKPTIRSYISNSGAETKLRFNKYAGVADLPLYMERHTIANRFTFPDSVGMLIRLTQSITVISVAASAQVTSLNHGLTSGDTIYIVDTNSTPVINGAQVVTVVDADNFTVPVTTSVAGTRGEWLSSVQFQQVTEAGIDYTTMQPDWSLLRGRSGLFHFQKIVVDGSDRITQIIEYPAGARAGDFGKITNYTYSGANKSPSSVTEIPYVLQSADLMTP